VALVFGAVNTIVKPILMVLTFPFLIVTLGLFLLVLNAAMLWLTGAISDAARLGFHVSSFLQYYSSLPFNITSGVANLQGTNSRPLIDGATAPSNFDVRTVALIARNAGIGSDFFSLNLRLSRAFPIASGVKIEGLVEAFNLTNRANPLTRNSNFGPGAYPMNPVATFNQITAVGDPRVVQFGLRLTF